MRWGRALGGPRHCLPGTSAKETERAVVKLSEPQFTVCEMGLQAGSPWAVWRRGPQWLVTAIPALVVQGWLALLLSFALSQGHTDCTAHTPSSPKHQTIPQLSPDHSLNYNPWGKKTAPRSHQGNPMPLSVGPRPSRPAPTLYLSNLTGPGMGSMCTLSGSTLLPGFHPSSGWGSGLAREALEGNWKPCRAAVGGSQAASPGPLPSACCSTELCPERTSHCAHFPDRKGEGPRE